MSKRDMQLPGWPAAMRKPMAAAYTARGIRDLEKAIARGELVARRDGRRLLLLKADLDAYLASLPKAKSSDIPRPGSE